MRVLVTGGAGFIGSHTADLLLKRGYQVRILDNLSSRTHFDGWPKYLDSRIEKINGDITKEDDLKKSLVGVDYVVHLAALMDLINDFSLFSETNTKSTSLIYEIIVKKKLPIKKILIASSQFVYGEGRWKCEIHGEVFPNARKLADLEKGNWDPICPIGGEEITPLSNRENHQDPPNAYAISKYTQELIALKLGGLYHIPTVVLRYSIVHGPRQSFKNLYSGALRIFTLQLLLRQAPTIFEDGRQLRDYISVHDVTQANVLVLESEKADYEIFNVGGDIAYSVLDLYEIVSKKLGVSQKPQMEGEFRLGDIRHAVSDISKLKALGWSPKTAEETAVSDYIDWIINQKIDKKYVESAQKNLESMGTLRKPR